MQSREYWDIPEEFADAYRRFRPTPLWRAHACEEAVGARVAIWVEYEGGNISGSHKLNTALGVLIREVGDAAGGWLAFECGVSAVVIVGVQPAGEGVTSFLL